MDILLTGASSFTGYWFADRLASLGHRIVAPLRRPITEYQDGTRAERVQRLSKIAETPDDIRFGDDRFLDLVNGQNFDLFCHHGAMVDDYRSPDFDVGNAVGLNTRSLHRLLPLLKASGLWAVVLTGSVFEKGEGARPDGITDTPAITPYGRSKSLTTDAFRTECAKNQIPLGRFIIPNPFGPLEEQRFCHYLISCWAKKKTAKVQTPAYIRDNIHVGLLAWAYGQFCEGMMDSQVNKDYRPSGYVETQGAFAERFAKEMHKRLLLDSPLELADQKDFAEPESRINADPVNGKSFNWSEDKAWDRLADYYAKAFGLKL